MNKYSAKFLLRVADTFKDLSEISAKQFEDTGDSFFEERMQAYTIAAFDIERHIEENFNGNISELSDEQTN